MNFLIILNNSAIIFIFRAIFVYIAIYYLLYNGFRYVLDRVLSYNKIIHIITY